MIRDVTQDANFPPARPETRANPTGEIRRNSRIAREQFENFFESIQCWAHFLHSRETEVYTWAPKSCGKAWDFTTGTSPFRSKLASFGRNGKACGPRRF